MKSAENVSNWTGYLFQAWVEEYFSGVPNSDIPRQTFSHLLEPFDTPEFNKIYKVAPVQNVYQLDMNWALPPLMDKYRSKPLHYLSWIIGHEGRLSVIHNNDFNVYCC